MRCKLLALDLDDTLLGPDRQAGPRERRAVRAVREMGAIPVVATGRPYASASLIAQQLETESPVISNSGALVHDSDGTILRELRLDRDLCLEVLRTATTGDLTIYVYTSAATLTNREHELTLRYSSILQVPISQERCLEDQLRSSKFHVHALGLRVDADDAGDLERELEATFKGEAWILRSVPTLVEILPPGASKGSALEFLCDHLDIPVQDTAAIGDGLGDMDMLQVAGCGILVANADEQLHDQVDMVTDQPHTDGVMEAIEHLFPGFVDHGRNR